MKYEIEITKKFRKDVSKVEKRGLDLDLLKDIVLKLANGEQLSEKNRDHPLSNNWSGYRECHIQPDWLLVYKIQEDKLILSLTRTGTHSDLNF